MPGTLLRRRILLCLAVVAVALVALTVRLGFLQSARHDQLLRGAARSRLRVVPVQPKRGQITDRNGNPLALSVDVPTVYANPSEVRDKGGTARALAPLLGADASRLEQVLSRRSMFEWLARKVTIDQAQAVRQLDLPGIYLTREAERFYPRGPLAAQVIGFSGIDAQGLAGVEYSYDRVLSGQPGRIEIEYDAWNQPIPAGARHFVPPKDGRGLALTLDETLQAIAERDLAREALEHGAKAGSIAMMDPRTGELLALAVYPPFDPNRYAEYPPALWRDAFISDTISPGSVFKPVTAVAGLDTGTITPDTGFYDPGFVKVPGAVIHNWNNAGRGSTSFRQGFIDSANVVFAQVGLRVGTENFYRYLDAFGLRSRTGVDLPGEALGLFPNPARVKPVDLAVMAFGQTLTATPVGMLAALGAVANDGILMWPHIGKAVIDGNEAQPIAPRVRGRVMSPETARTVRELMRGVVEEGTGQRAQVPGYDVGGKTGTTNKVVGGVVSRTNYIASFFGLVPADAPRLVVYVILDEPQGTPYGGFVAAPAFQTVVSDALRYLGVQPQRPDEVPAPAVESLMTVPSLVNLTPDQARQAGLTAGLRVEVVGPAEGRIRQQMPSAGAGLVAGSLVLAYTGDAQLPPPVAVTVPDLSGRSLGEVAGLLGRLGLMLDAGGQGVAVSQDPSAGTLVTSGTVVRVEFGGGGRG